VLRHGGLEKESVGRASTISGWRFYRRGATTFGPKAARKSMNTSTCEMAKKLEMRPPALSGSGRSLSLWWWVDG